MAVDTLRSTSGLRYPPAVTRYSWPPNFKIDAVVTVIQNGAKRIISALEGSLKRLGTDWIDLSSLARPTTPIDETLAALEQLVREGKVIEIGCSNFEATMLEGALTISDQPGLGRFASCMNLCSALQRPHQAGIVRATNEHGLKLVTYFLLAGGLLSGKYRRGEPSPDGRRFAGDSAISKILATRKPDGRTASASQPLVGSIIAGAT
jgi:aryl-alcohol dehydrogenase-like predicted oxidoreductase